MVKVKCTEIQWDTDGDKELFESLPKEVEITLDDYTEGDYLDDELADTLSDFYGFCVEGYNYEIIESTKYYDINYRLETTSLFTVEAKDEEDAKRVALEELDCMSKNELIERFLSALDFDPTFEITNVNLAEEN